MAKSKKQKLKEKAWRLFSQYIRRKYADENGLCTCYTCGKRDLWQCMDAGHAVPGRGNAVLLNERVVRVQCKRCNIFNHGEYGIFAVNLAKEYGIDEVERLQNLKYETVKVSIAEYEQLIAELQAQLMEFDEQEASRAV